MKTTIPCLLLLCILQNVVAQTDYTRYRVDDPYMISMRHSIMGVEYSNPVIANKGAQFFNDWANGEIILANGDLITGLRLSYEKYRDQLLFQNEDFISCVICKTCIKAFKLYDDNNKILASFVLKKGITLPLENDSADCFFQTLVEGEYSFFAFRKAVILPDDFILADDTRYYVFYKDRYKKIRLRMKDLLNVPFLDKNRMKSIITENRLRLNNNEQQFIKAISFYNQ
jgi:hypothetical protein